MSRKVQRRSFMKGVGAVGGAGLAGRLSIEQSKAHPDQAASSASESGARSRLQGQVPIEDQESGRSLRPYTENMRLVGENDIKNRGMNGNLGWIDDCAYVSSYFGADHPLAGLAVVDASNPKNPELVEIHPGTPGTRESQVEANEERNMVVVMPFSSELPDEWLDEFGDISPGPTLFQIYQASEDDCRELEQVGTYDFGDVVTHEHRISEDGNTVWAAVNSGEHDALHAVDVSDMANPELVTTWDLEDDPEIEIEEESSGIHDLEVSQDGTRAYLNLDYVQDGTEFGGLTIVDTTEVAERQSDPEITRISTVNWTPPEGFGGSHSAQLAHIEGRTYIIAMDETFNREGCPWGWARIIDVEEEEHPRQISTFRLEVNMRRHCDETTPDEAMYSSHYLGVDDVNDTSMVFFTWYSSGLRAVDIRDPYDPTEIGYYIPGANPDTVLPDRERFGNRQVPYAYSFVRYRPESGHIWYNDVFKGFQIVELVKDCDELDRDTGKHL